MTTGLITPKPTEGQEVQFERVVLDTVRQARKVVDFDKDGMQRLLGNGGKFKEDVISLLVKYSAFNNNRYGLFNSFELTVPKGYMHGTQLATFAKYAKNRCEKFNIYNENITDINYSGATQQLIPGKTYGVKIFYIKQPVTTEDNLAFLASQRAILVGAQGLSLTRQLKKNKFPVGKWTVSFDEKDALWKCADGNHGVPVMRLSSGGGWDFGVSHFEGKSGWRHVDCLLCFYELLSLSA